MKNRIKKLGFFHMKLWEKKIITALIVATSILPLFSSAQIMAGGFTMGKSGAGSLRNPMSVAKGVGNFGFCSAVGGVAFGEMAVSEDGSVIERLMYHKDRADGERLEALVRKGSQIINVTLPVYDWEFIPAARFAGGSQDAVATFFGSLSDKAEEARLRGKGCKFMNYHKDIANTLMGLRLIQADLLAFHSIGPLNFSEGGLPIKGSGEKLASESSNKMAIAPIKEYYGSSGIQSYVICDVGQKIGFSMVGAGSAKQLRLSGNPYWSCWNAKISEEELQMKLAMAFYSQLSTTEQTLLLENEELLTSRLTEFIQKEGKTQMMQAQKEAFRRLSIESDQLSKLMKKHEGGNPPVYHALTKFMRYSALFRYAKDRNKSGYEAFLKSLSGVSLVPSIETPTVLYPPNN